MARKNKTPKADPAELKARVWVIERRDRIFTGSKWKTFDIRTKEEFNEVEIVEECSKLSECYMGNEFRYRAATLTFDDDGRKRTIYQTQNYV